MKRSSRFFHVRATRDLSWMMSRDYTHHLSSFVRLQDSYLHKARSALHEMIEVNSLLTPELKAW
jgi:hypothetical protein